MLHSDSPQDDSSSPSSQEELSSYLEKHEAILSADHFLVTRQRAQYFFQPVAASPAEYYARVRTGRQLLQLANTLEPGLSAAREAVLVSLGTCLQFLLGAEVMARLAGEQQEAVLAEEQVWDILYPDHLARCGPPSGTPGCASGRR